jgi:hypothetical protein
MSFLGHRYSFVQKRRTTVNYQDLGTWMTIFFISVLSEHNGTAFVAGEYPQYKFLEGGFHYTYIIIIVPEDRLGL